MGSESIISTYRLRKTHQTIKRGGVVREVDTLSSRYSEGMRVQGEIGDRDVVRDDISRHLACSIGNGELFACVYEAGAGLTSKKVVIALKK